MKDREVFARHARVPVPPASVLAALVICSITSTTLISCVGNTYDNPNRTEPDPSERVERWSVQDEAGTVLASACYVEKPATPLVVQAEPGQALVLEVNVAGVVKTENGGGTDEWWCSDEGVVSETRAASVDNLECFEFPESHGIAVERWEAIQPGRPVDALTPHLMSGSGYRLYLRVERSGTLYFVPNGTCRSKGWAALEVRTS
jgi:hypothetical protein